MALIESRNKIEGTKNIEKLHVNWLKLTEKATNAISENDLNIDRSNDINVVKVCNFQPHLSSILIRKFNKLIKQLFYDFLKFRSLSKIS
jgi:hypothetical protein